MEEKETQPLIEILKCDDYNTKKKGQAKFKVKRINPKLILLCEKDFLEVKMPAETAFDFMARQLPDNMYFGFVFSNTGSLSLLEDISLYREKRQIDMIFTFSINTEQPPTGDLNPFIVLNALRKKLIQERYKTIGYLDELSFGVVFKVPQTDNVYPHYQKHLAALEKICRTIESDMIKRLNKKTGAGKLKKS